MHKMLLASQPLPWRTGRALPRSETPRRRSARRWSPRRARAKVRQVVQSPPQRAALVRLRREVLRYPALFEDVGAVVGRLPRRAIREDQDIGIRVVQQLQRRSGLDDDEAV